MPNARRIPRPLEGLGCSVVANSFARHEATSRAPAAAADGLSNCQNAMPQNAVWPPSSAPLGAWPKTRCISWNFPCLDIVKTRSPLQRCLRREPIRFAFCSCLCRRISVPSTRPMVEYTPNPVVFRTIRDGLHPFQPSLGWAWSSDAHTRRGLLNPCVELEVVSFAGDVLPLLDTHCNACHSASGGQVESDGLR